MIDDFDWVMIIKVQGDGLTAQGFSRALKYKRAFMRHNMTSRLTYQNHDDFALLLPNNQDIKKAVRSLFHAYKAGAISEANLNRIIEILIATSIENDLADKLFRRIHKLDEKINRFGRL